MKKSNILRISFGNIIEWYDFSLFGFFATKMNQVFFPDLKSGTGLVMMFGIFGIGFVSRPLGGYILGKIGDKLGHKLAVNLAVLGMSLSTFLMALLPTYHMLGFSAVILLLFLRLMQWFSAGGQFTGVLTLSVNESQKHRSFLSMLSVSISTLGFFLASLVVLLLNLFLPAHLETYAWRIAFLLSIILFYIYWRIRPHDATEHSSGSVTKFSVREILQEQPKEFFGSMILSFVIGFFYFFIYTYMFTYLTTEFHLSEYTGSTLSTIQIMVGCLLFPLFGYLGDKYGKFRLFYIASFAIPGFMFMMLNTSNINYVFAAMLLLTVAHCALGGGSYSVMVEVFEEKWRMSASGLSYNIGVGIAGFCPMLVQAVVNYAHNVQAIFYLSLACCVLGLFGMYLIWKSDGCKLVS